MSSRRKCTRREFLKSTALGGLAVSTGSLNLMAQENQKADLVFHGGTILTADASNSIKNAIAIKGNRILAVARDIADIQPFISSTTKVIQLGQRCITPGIIDVHNHIVAQVTTTINWIDLIQCKNADDVRRTIADWIIEHDWPQGKWIRAVGYMWLWDKVAQAKEGVQGPPLLTRWDMDQVVETRGKKIDLSAYPMYLIQLSGHYSTMNGLALRKAKIMNDSGHFNEGSDSVCLTVPSKKLKEVFSPEIHKFGSFFQEVLKDGSKQISGTVFHHYAMEEFVVRAYKFGDFPQLDEKELLASMKQRCQEFIKLGVTSIYDNNLRLRSHFDAIKAYHQNAQPNEKLRITLYPYICHQDNGAFPAFDQGSRKGILSRTPMFDGAWMRLIGYKLQIDAGAIAGLTWELNKSYGGTTHGDLNLWEYNDYLAIIKELDKRGAQISAHVIGDKALDWTLDAYEKAGVGGKNRRHRLEHLACVPAMSRNGITSKNQALLKRAKDLDLIFCPQPGFILYYGMFWERAFGSGTGEQTFPRLTHSVPYKSAVDAGIKVALSSDNPCVPNVSPLLAIWESVHRRTMKVGNESRMLMDSYVFNHPDERGSTVDERVDFNQALRGHTIDAAYCGFEEKEKGSLEEGKLADLVVWNKDIRTIGERMPVASLKEIKPVMTVIDGKIVYENI